MEVSANGSNVAKVLTDAGLPSHLSIQMASIAPDADAAVKAWKSIDLKVRFLVFGLFAFSCAGAWLLAKAIVRDQVAACVDSPVIAFLVQLLLHMFASVCAAGWIIGYATRKSPLELQCQRFVGSFLTRSDAEIARSALRIHKRFKGAETESVEAFVRNYTTSYLPVFALLTILFVIASAGHFAWATYKCLPVF